MPSKLLAGLPGEVIIVILAFAGVCFFGWLIYPLLIKTRNKGAEPLTFEQHTMTNTARLMEQVEDTKQAVQKIERLAEEMEIKIAKVESLPHKVEDLQESLLAVRDIVNQILGQLK